MSRPGMVSTAAELLMLPVGTVLAGPSRDAEVYQKTDDVTFYATGSETPWLASNLEPRGPHRILFNPTLYQSAPGESELTERQTKALAGLTEEAIQRHGVEMTEWSTWNQSWVLRFREEIRPGRGRDVDLVYLDGETVVWITIDVYGSSRMSIAETNWTHNDSDEECACEPCAADREQQYREESNE